MGFLVGYLGWSVTSALVGVVVTAVGSTAKEMVDEAASARLQLITLQKLIGERDIEGVLRVDLRELRTIDPESVNWPWDKAELLDYLILWRRRVEESAVALPNDQALLVISFLDGVGRHLVDNPEDLEELQAIIRPLRLRYAATKGDEDE